MSLIAGFEERRGGRQRPGLSVRRPRALAAHVLAIVAAMVMVLSGVLSPNAQAAGFAGGTVTVICADGVAKTVVLDDEGNPMDPSGAEACAGICLCGPAPGVALPPEAQGVVPCSGEMDGVIWPTAAAVLLFERGRCASPRGPPSEDMA